MKPESQPSRRGQLTRKCDSASTGEDVNWTRDSPWILDALVASPAGDFELADVDGRNLNCVEADTADCQRTTLPTGQMPDDLTSPQVRATDTTCDTHTHTMVRLGYISSF